MKEGEAHDIVSPSTGERFSLRYVIPGDPNTHPATFVYENYTQKALFRLHSLTWVGFSNSLLSQEPAGQYDTVTFTGFGVWHKDGVERVEQAAVQISTAGHAPYIGVQIGSGYVTNADTKPDNPDDALP